MVFVDVTDEISHFIGDAREKCSFHLGGDDSSEAKRYRR